MRSLINNVGSNDPTHASDRRPSLPPSGTRALGLTLEAPTQPAAELRVLVIEDDPQLQALLVKAFASAGFEVVGSAASYAEAASHLASRPTVAVGPRLDRQRGGAIETARELVSSAVKVLIQIGPEDREDLRAALEARASSSSQPGSAGGLLDLLLRHVAGAADDGERFAADRATTGCELLTPRERDVLSLLAGGLTTAGVADELGVASETVKTHVQHALHKLRARTRTHAVAIAAALGEIELR